MKHFLSFHILPVSLAMEICLYYWDMLAPASAGLYCPLTMDAKRNRWKKAAKRKVLCFLSRISTLCVHGLIQWIVELKLISDLSCTCASPASVCKSSVVRCPVGLSRRCISAIVFRQSFPVSIYLFACIESVVFSFAVCFMPECGSRSTLNLPRSRTFFCT